MRTWYLVMRVIGARSLVPPRPTFGTYFIFAGVALVALGAIAFLVGVADADAGADCGSEVRIPRRDDARTRAIDGIAHVAIPRFIIIFGLRVFPPRNSGIGQEMPTVPVTSRTAPTIRTRKSGVARAPSGSSVADAPVRAFGELFRASHTTRCGM